MERLLVYDVGHFDGYDTAYYLSRQCRVVAIEANPDLFASARSRFAEPIAVGQLTLLNVAIADHDGTTSFWISDRKDWSSLDYSISTREGENARQIEVPCRRFRSILEEYGVPDYLKLDIEGADALCLADINPLNAPRYLSFEVSRLEDLIAARSIGYNRFKCIGQMDFRELRFDPCRFETWLRLALRQHARLNAIIQTVNRLRHRLRNRRKSPPIGGNDWQFVPGRSSGPFGEETDGPWQSFEQVAFNWLAYRLGYTHLGKPAISQWFDVHAMQCEAICNRSKSSRE